MKRVKATSASWFTAAVAAAGLMTGGLEAAQIGINFQDDWGTGGGAEVTEEAQGVPAGNWFNMPRVPNSGSAAFATNQTIALPGGGELNVAWRAVNTWSITADIPTTVGDDQLVYGYLDDTGTGYTVTLTGFRNFASSYTITTIASSDSADGFMNTGVTTDNTTNTLAYPSPMGISYGSGLWAVSEASGAIDATSGNNRATITGEPKANLTRSTLAGLLINYTPATANLPLVETQPAAPTETIFKGQPFSLTVQASGSQPLNYQWRKDGVAIEGATNATLTLAASDVADSGSYDVVISNSAGNATSTPVTISISDATAPAITKGPLSEMLYAGYPATLRVQATGGQLTYTWAKDGTTIPGATTDTLSFNALTAADQGTYTVTVSNPVGNTTATATLTVKTTAASAYEAAVVSRLPLVYFRMNDANVRLFDFATNRGSIGTGANGAYVGAITRGVAGAVAAENDTAVSLSGGRVVVPYTAGLNPNGSFTAEVWAKPLDTTAGNRVLIQSMVNGEHPENPDDRSGWSLRQNGANLQFLHGGATLIPAAYYDTFTALGAVTAGVWSHYAVVYNAPANSLTLFVNGAAVTNFTPSVPLEPNTAAPVMLGDRGYGGWTFAGALDEPAVYASALTPAQLLAHYQNGVAAAPATPYSTLVANDGALLHLRLNEAAAVPNAPNAGTLGSAWGGTYTDATGKPSAPAIAVGAAGPRPPEFEGFEATNLAVSITNGFVLAPPVQLANQVTAAVWVYREEPETGDGDLSWLAWVGDGGFHMNPDGELRYHWNGQRWDWASNLRVPVRTWTLAVLVIEPDKATIYMSEGEKLLSAVNNNTHAPMAGSSPLGVGGNQPGRADRHYRGKLDEAAVFNRALTSGEVAYLWAQATAAELRMQVVPGGVIEDSKTGGTAHHAPNRGAVWVASNSDAGSPARTRTGVAQFSAAEGSQIVLPADADFNSTTGTIMFWMKAPAPLPGPGNEGAILVDRRALGDAGGGDVIVLNDAGAIFVQAETPPGRTTANTFSIGYLPDELWHHVAYVYDQSLSGSISIYIDGVLAGSNPNTTNWAWAPAQPIEIGRSHDGYWKRFEGMMDDFRIYNRVLSEQEISQIVTNDAVVDANALKVRLNFNTSGIGESIVWPYGTLESSPTLGPDAVWTPVPDATSPYGFIPPTSGSIFFRVRL